MREAIKDKNRLAHMLDAIKVIQDRTSGMTLENLMEDKIEGMRHHIVHGYFQVREDMLWNVIQKDLQPLKEQLTKYIDRRNYRMGN